MKRFVWVGAVLVAVLGIAFILGNRGQELSITDNSNQISVVTSVPLLKYLVEKVGGEEVAVTSIIKGATCSHEFEPSTGDMKKIARVQLVIKAGKNFDSWFDKLVDSSTDKLKIIDASRGIHVLAEVDDHKAHKEEAEETEEAEHHHHDAINPHYWGDPENVRIMAKNIMEELIALRPDKKRVFTANYQAFDSELTSNILTLKKKVNALKDKRVVSYSAAFPYFFSYFGFLNLETVETTCEQEVSPKRLLEVASLIKQEKIRVIVGEQVYPTLPEELAKETGAQVVLLWPSTVDSGDYLKTMNDNVERMVSALQ